MFGAPGTSAGLGQPAQNPAALPAKEHTIPMESAQLYSRSSKGRFSSVVSRKSVVHKATMHGSGWDDSASKPNQSSSSACAENTRTSTSTLAAGLNTFFPIPESSHRSMSESGTPHGDRAKKAREERFSNPFEDIEHSSPIQATGVVHSPNLQALSVPDSASSSKAAAAQISFASMPTSGRKPPNDATSGANRPIWSPPSRIAPPLQQGNSSSSSIRRQAVNHLVSSARSPTSKVLALTGHGSLGEAMNCLFEAWATVSPDGQRRIRPLAFAAIIALHGPPSILSHIESFRYFNLPLLLGVTVYSSLSGSAYDNEEEEMEKILELAKNGPSKNTVEGFGSRSAPLRRLVEDFFGVTPLVSTVTRFSRTNVSARSPATYIRSTAMKSALHLYRTRGPACFEEMKQAVFSQVLAIKPWLESLEGGLTLDQWQRNYSVCPRCTVMRIERSAGDFFIEGAHNLCIGIIRTRPSKELGCLGTHVRCCDHYQWKWCPGFEVTKNEKCLEAPCRSDACPRYFARSTIWKHHMRPGEEKNRGAKRRHDDGEEDWME